LGRIGISERCERAVWPAKIRGCLSECPLISGFWQAVEAPHTEQAIG
jgi:hypothetical protein